MQKINFVVHTVIMFDLSQVFWVLMSLNDKNFAYIRGPKTRNATAVATRTDAHTAQRSTAATRRRSRLQA